MNIETIKANIKTLYNQHKYLEKTEDSYLDKYRHKIYAEGLSAALMLIELEESNDLHK